MLVYFIYDDGGEEALQASVPIHLINKSGQLTPNALTLLPFWIILPLEIVHIAGIYYHLNNKKPSAPAAPAVLPAPPPPPEPYR